MVRVGGERPVRVNVRIVAATHRDLPGMVEQQTFREDLYYRLSVFPIVIPPLRDRPSDIRAFAEYFAERAANRFGLRPVPVSDDDVQRARGVSVAGQRPRDGGRDGPRGADRPGTHAERCRRPRPGRAPGQSVAVALRLTPGRRRIEPLDVVIRRHIEAALEATHGRVEGPHGAARLLQINPHTLRARMRKLQDRLARASAIGGSETRRSRGDASSGGSSDPPIPCRMALPVDTPGAITARLRVYA